MLKSYLLFLKSISGRPKYSNNKKPHLSLYISVLSQEDRSLEDIPCNATLDQSQESSGSSGCSCEYEEQPSLPVLQEPKVEEVDDIIPENGMGNESTGMRLYFHHSTVVYYILLFSLLNCTEN